MSLFAVLEKHFMSLLLVQVNNCFFILLKNVSVFPLLQYAIILDICSLQMYVPGKLNDVENVLVNVGTGYYVEKVIIFRCLKPIITGLSFYDALNSTCPSA